MTPTATYIAEENCLQEISQMEKPIEPHRYHYDLISLGGLLYDSDVKNYRLRLDDYNAHLASLRTIICSPECKGLWPDKAVLEEGKDYEVKMDCKYPVSCFVEETCNCVFTAFPLIPVKSEDDSLNDEVLLNTRKLFVEDSRRGFSYLNPGTMLTLNDWHKIYDNATVDFIAELKSKYIITKR